MKTSYSQFGQDNWVIRLFRGKQRGFFIELGAGDGMNLSNTFMLEKKYHWTGILIEPTRIFEKLKINRPDCITVNVCIASERKIVNLFEVYDRGQIGDNLLLSTVREDLDIQNGVEVNSEWGVFERAYQQEAFPLSEILNKCNAPKVIDYFSLDVEGYEYDILKNFPFQDYTFLCIGIERPPKELCKLLLDNGYKLITNVACDEMYLHKNIGRFLLYRIIIIGLISKLMNLVKTLPFSIGKGKSKTIL